MSDYAISAQVLDFPPCSSVEQIQFIELLLFGFFPGLTTFIRETTAFERAVGVAHTHVLVTKSEGKSRAFTDAQFRSTRKNNAN